MADPTGFGNSVERRNGRLHSCSLSNHNLPLDCIPLAKRNATMGMFLSTSAVAGLTGATIRMVDHWARTGLIRPTGTKGVGKGSRRRYTFQDVVVLQAIQRLREANCPLRKIRTAIRYLKTHYPTEPTSEKLAKLTLLTDGHRVYLLTDEHQLMEVVTGQLQITWAVPLGRIILDTSQRLENMPQMWTEAISIKRRAFRIIITRKGPTSPFVAQCRELPGLIAEAPSAAEAAKVITERITSVIGNQSNIEPRRQARLSVARA